MLYTWDGIMNMKNYKWRDDFSVIDNKAQSSLSRTYTKAYLRHLFQVKEILACQIASIHNLAFYIDLVQTARTKIIDGEFDIWKAAVMPKLKTRL